ncbi:MAG: hypothetical protein J1E78_03625 [Muribaculaceae bacterium]|nr:hypothetical protein [Muribaculaceae bacterium]
MINEDDNIYIYNESEEDDSPLNFANSQDNDDAENGHASKKESAISPFKLMFEILFNPVQGWKKLRRSNVSVQRVQSGCFYPLLAILALSNFVDFFYTVNASLSEVVTKAVVAFVSYFFGYFCIIMLLKTFLAKNVAEYFSRPYGENFVVMSLSTLALFSIFIEILPMLWPILIFLPLWTIYIMYKGTKYFKMQECQTIKSAVLIMGSVICLPLMLDWLLNAIMPY